MRFVLRGATAASTLLFALGASTAAHAAGFQLKEQSAEGLGHAFAGMTAKADNYDTLFYNPAGMTRLETGMGASVSYIMPVSEFTNGGSSTTSPVTSLGPNPSGDTVDDAALPALYGVWKVNPDLALGMSINVPYGLVTDHDSDWIGRYHALKSDLETYSFQPAIAYRVAPKLSLGAGLNIQYAKAELTKAVDFTTIDAALTASPAITSSGANGDGKSKVEGNDLSLGYTLSALYEVTDQTRVGVHYRSRVRHNLDGEVKISNAPLFTALVPAAQATVDSANATFANGDASAEFTTPDSAHIGIYHQFTDEWAGMADVSWTNWSLFRSLIVERDNGQIASAKEENWDDSWFFSLGASYAPAALPDWAFSAGVAYDQTPVPDAYRTPRVPDSDRTWLAFGASYKPSDRIEMTLGYTHIFAEKASIDDTETVSGVDYTLQGHYDSHVDIVAAGMTYTF